MPLSISNDNEISGLENGLTMNINLKTDTQVTEVVHYNYIESGAVIGINYNPYGTTIDEPIGIKPNSLNWVSMKSRKRMVKEPILKIFPKDCHDGLHLDILKGVQYCCVHRCQPYYR